MSDRTRNVLNFITQYRANKGISPTYREIGKACNINSTSLVKFHLDKLEATGHIRRLKGVARGIILVEAATQ